MQRLIVTDQLGVCANRSHNGCRDPRARGAEPIEAHARAAQSGIIGSGGPGSVIDRHVLAVEEDGALHPAVQKPAQLMAPFDSAEYAAVARQCSDVVGTHGISSA